LKTRNIVILLIVLALLGGVYYVFARPEPTEPEPGREYIWSIDEGDLTQIDVKLPRVEDSQYEPASFIKITEGDSYTWYFNDAVHSPINPSRWGGGITLLLSGPGADRVLTKTATSEKLREWGLNQPKMIISLLFRDGTPLEIDLGDATPDGSNYYIHTQFSKNTVATVAKEWFDEVARLVKDPPHVTTTASTTQP
jgi:hypothetical protein